VRRRRSQQLRPTDTGICRCRSQGARRGQKLAVQCGRAERVRQQVPRLRRVYGFADLRRFSRPRADRFRVSAVRLPVTAMPGPGQQISVLVVEDDDVLRSEFAAMIDAAVGIELLEAVGSLSAARASLAAHGAPDVLVVDLGLPDGDGTALIGELAAAAPQS